MHAVASMIQQYKQLEQVLIYSELEDNLFSDECDSEYMYSDFMVGEVESEADPNSVNSSIYFAASKMQKTCQTTSRGSSGMTTKKVWFILNTDNDSARVNDYDLTPKEQMVEPLFLFSTKLVMISSMEATDLYF
jgi:hypothetical protein